MQADIWGNVRLIYDPFWLRPGEGLLCDSLRDLQEEAQAAAMVPPGGCPALCCCSRPPLLRQPPMAPMPPSWLPVCTCCLLPAHFLYLLLPSPLKLSTPPLSPPPLQAPRLLWRVP